MNQPAPSGASLTLCGRVGEGVVDLDHLAGDRGEDLARRLDRLDDGGLGALGELLADVRQLDIDDVAELLLGVVA